MHPFETVIAAPLEVLLKLMKVMFLKVKIEFLFAKFMKVFLFKPSMTVLPDIPIKVMLAAVLLLGYCRFTSFVLLKVPSPN